MDLGAAGVMIAPPPALRTDDQIINYYAQAVTAIGTDIPFVHPGLSAGAERGNDSESHTADCDG
jgi:hypothetical protein